MAETFRPATIYVAVAGLALGGLGSDLAYHLGLSGDRAAQAAQAGYLAAEADIDVPTAHPTEAGYRWAKRHDIDQAGACPRIAEAFRQGCEAWVKDVAEKGHRRTVGAGR